jgi:NADH dehydrogenase (ubiquinone) 1 alpha subcomplex subunit 5
MPHSMRQSPHSLVHDGIADTSSRIKDIENKIGAGLIEEVLQVAEGELTLAGEMAESRVYGPLLVFHALNLILTIRRWEPLEEQPADGQWRYHERPNPV